MWDGTGLCLYSKRLEKGRFAQLWGEDTLAEIRQ
jgi:transposase